MKLYNGDCLEVMKLIPDKSIDAIITDPPYGTTACKWDSVIPFEPMWEQLNRIIKPNGAIILFGSEPFSSALRMSNINNYKYDWIWKKNKLNGFLNAKNKPLKSVENVLIFSDGVTANTRNTHKKMTYYPQGLVKINKERKNGNRKHDSIIGNRPSRQGEYIKEFTNYPRDILEFKNTIENKQHPTQKPVALMEYLIKTYTNENETVLDFTMGSGTTGVACCNTNRDFIGIELDKNYFKIAEQRIKNEL